MEASWEEGGLGNMNFNKNCPSQLSSFCHFLPGKKPFFPQLQRALLKKELFPQPTAQEGTVKIDFSHSVVQECTVKKKLFSRVQLEHALLKKKGFPPTYKLQRALLKKRFFYFSVQLQSALLKKRDFPQPTSSRVHCQNMLALSLI